MKKKEWNEGLNHLDPDLVEKYVEQKDRLENRKKTKGRWLRLGAVAASFALIIGAVAVVPRLRAHGFPSIFPSHDAPPDVDASPGLEQTTFGFDSYKEMIKAFRRYDLLSSTDTIQGLKASLGEAYTSFVDRVNHDRAFPHPMHNGQPVAFRNKEGFSNITFFVQERYGLPWIAYYPEESTGGNFYIIMTYLPDSIAEVQDDLNASEVIKQLAPNAPNVNNLGASYKDIYNQTIALADREVTALVYEFKDDTRNMTTFIYDDLLISVRGDPALWDAQWFSALSFEMLK